jgi:predicted sulfurtransferase
MVAAGKVSGKVIVDVRNKEEIADGLFANAIHIPLDVRIPTKPTG